MQLSLQSILVCWRKCSQNTSPAQGPVQAQVHLTELELSIRLPVWPPAYQRTQLRCHEQLQSTVHHWGFSNGNCFFSWDELIQACKEIQEHSIASKKCFSCPLTWMCDGISSTFGFFGFYWFLFLSHPPIHTHNYQIQYKDTLGRTGKKFKGCSILPFWHISSTPFCESTFSFTLLTLYYTLCVLLSILSIFSYQKV